ncbi:type II toxin-antitoxin system RatA family toxin [Halorientalis litorea]|uniref:type II toxin-antitoxin system RatA family toxin n=1 Tax=Halorientalis litorea TaxID=2931977 RepID=UPI001FF381AA|nr:SRPBCC family protein [Halorientalis litorea]
MDEVEVSTVVYVPPEEVYEFLVDFPGYANYSKYLQRVRATGDGTPGTRYYMEFAWWKLTYTAHSEVTDIDPPHQVDWQIIKDIDAEGHWNVEPLPEAAPDGKDHACRVRLRVTFHPDSADSDTLELPRFVSISWVIEKAKPLIQGEAERVVERIVADLEGETRPVDLEIHATPDSV